MENTYDLCVVGGGVNGAGIARDAAGRGLKTLLVEAGDLAGATSSASTKLIHGGLRYLEYYEFRLVREALTERTILLGIAPHLIRPMVFVLPHESHLRPAWMIRAGLFLYDRLGGLGGLPRSRGLTLKGHPYGAPLKDGFARGFTYSDCWVDDARLVALNAMDARERGAEIRVRTACTSLKPAGGGWSVGMTDDAGTESTARASMVVNATGPWVRDLLDRNGLARAGTPGVRLVKGSHIVIEKLFEGDQAYILQQPDRRIVFAIPYEGRFTLIGTTDENYSGDPRAAHISDEETAYLCAAANRSFRRALTPQDVVWSYSGVRPLFDDGSDSASAVTRDYRLDLERFEDAPMLSVFGGKITTYRHLAADAVNRLTGGAGKAWTHAAPLPGGDLPKGGFEAFAVDRARRYPWLPPETVRRMAHAYGTRMDRVLGTASGPGDLGRDFGHGFHEAEIRYLMEEEFARTAEDILWRRTKMGLHLSRESADAVAACVSRMKTL